MILPLVASSHVDIFAFIFPGCEIFVFKLSDSISAQWKWMFVLLTTLKNDLSKIQQQSLFPGTLSTL